MVAIVKPVLSFIFLKPVSILWELAYRVRRFGYKYGVVKQNSFQVPIISVGNLTFGGTGKTPFTLWLADHFIKQNKKVVILMRGYKGRLENSSGILNSGRKMGLNPVDFGDEALVFCRRLTNTSVIVGKNRSENLEYYFDQELPDVVLLDDGHQHIKLKRKLNIVLFDALMPLGQYKVAPRGYLREGMTALQDAHAVVIGRVDQVNEEKVEKLKNFLIPHMQTGVPFAEIFYSPKGLYNPNYQKVYDAQDIRGKRVICVAGIASPLSFFDLVESLGADIVGKVSFPDHHYFKVEELTQLLAEADEKDAIIVTTEKDIVKMKRILDNQKILFLEIEVQFKSGQAQLEEIISQSIEF